MDKTKFRRLRRWIRLKRMLLRCSNWIINLILVVFGLAVVWIFLIVCCISSFRIPTDSMQPTLQPGDNILVKKWTMGARLFDVWDALEGKLVKIRRTPALGRIKRNDVLVFNFPLSKDWSRIEFDVMLYYAKRCVALPGDTLEVRNSLYQVRGTGEMLGDILQQQAMQHIDLSKLDDGVAHWNPRDTRWTLHEAGPLLVPATGSCVQLNRVTGLYYERMIEWEQGQEVRVEGDSVWMDGKVLREYCFQKNYYFMAGDHCVNSMDSRYWGLVPQEFIVGKAWLIWRSVDPYQGNFRWERFLKRIK